MFAGDLTINEIAEKGFDIAYFPIASLEQHGPHLPLTTDIIVSQALSEKISSNLNACMFPVQPFGTNYEHAGDRFSIGLDALLIYGMVLDIAREFKRQGFKKLVIHQGSPGLRVLYPLTRHLNACEGIKTVILKPFELLSAMDGILSTAGNVHACEIETSLMLYIDEKSVVKDKMQNIDFVPDVPIKYLDFKPLTAICPNGVWGNPSFATKEKGRILFEQGVDICTRHVAAAFDFMDAIGDYTGGREKEYLKKLAGDESQ
jgi:creatinine amidohydrolase